jgi:two-component system sensor histidine kinase PilS (NtrC family)
MSINLQGRIKSFNRAAEEITGFSFKDVENKNIVEVFLNYAEMQDKMKTEDHKGSVKNRFDVEIIGKGNKNLQLGCSVSFLKDTKGRRIGDILIFQDLTNIKKMEEALEKSRRLAFIGEMAAALAHEMRNPLASISGPIQVLRKDLELNTVDEKLMHIILRGKDQLENIIKDFLLLAKPSTGTRERLLIGEVISDVIECIQYVPDWNENIHISHLPSDNISIYANKTELREVIWNLILNAIQAMPDGGTLSVEAKRVFDDFENEFLEIRISDTGYGIDGKNLNKIFVPFFTTKERGTGLGLAIVNRIVEVNNGNIRVESTVEKGTTCVVSLPLM